MERRAVSCVGAEDSLEVLWRDLIDGDPKCVSDRCDEQSDVRRVSGCYNSRIITSLLIVVVRSSQLLTCALLNSGNVLASTRLFYKLDVFVMIRMMVLMFNKLGAGDCVCAC